MKNWCANAVVWLLCGHLALAATPGKNNIEVRGQTQFLYYYPAQGKDRGTVLLIPGDGGWRGFAITIAEKVSALGYHVFGLDTRRYLSSYSSSGGLSDENLVGDLRQLAKFALPEGKTFIVGWSEGAGMALVAANDAINRNLFKGIVSIGCTEKNVRMLKWSDMFAEAMKQTPKEPTFACSDYSGGVSPLPFAMIQSDHDEYVSRDETQKIFSRAAPPKQLTVIDAANHRFGGKEPELFRALEKALQWISESPGR